MSFLITTTGTHSPVVFADLGARSFTHPTTNFDLENEFTIDEIRYSPDIFSAITSGYITATYNGLPVTSVDDIKEVLSNDYRLYFQNELRVKKNPGLGEFSSIKDAVDSITTNSITNRFKVTVGPGLFIEDTITMKSYVMVEGSGEESTLVEVDDPSKNVFVLADESFLSSLFISGATNSGVSSILYSSGNVASAFVENVRFGDNNILMKVVGTGSGNCLIVCTNLKFGDGYYFDKGFVATNSGTGIGRIQVRNSTTISGLFSTLPTVVAIANAPGCQIIFNSAQLRTGAVAGSICFQAENGGILRLTAININGFNKGIYMPNVGAATSIRGLGVNFENNIMDVVVEHPGATGKIGFPDDRTKIAIDFDSTVYIPYKDLHIITVAKVGGDYFSIAAAVDSLTDSSITNRYTIFVGPGIFIEPEIDLTNRPYVNIEGTATLTTVVKPDSLNHHIFNLGRFCELSFMWIEGAGPGYAGVAYLDRGSFSQVHKLTFYDCDIGILITSVTRDTYLYGEFVDYNRDYNYGTKVISSNGFIAFVNMENYYNFPTVEHSPNILPVGTYLSGTAAQVYVLTSGNITTSTGNPPIGGTAFYAENGGYLNISAIVIQGWNIGVHMANVGSASTIRALSVVQDFNLVYDLLIEHPAGAGGYQGTANMDLVNVDINSNFNIAIQAPNGSLNISESLNIRFPNGIITDVSTLIIAGTMGVISGGVLSAIGSPPFVVDISDGYGYLELFPDQDFLSRIDWTGTFITLAPNTTNYIFFNYNGILSVDSSAPNTFYNILLGRVVTNSVGIEFIDASPLAADHNGNRLSLMARNALGPIYVSGSIVTEHNESPSLPFHLNVSQGQYHFAENRFLPSGETNITFVSYYEDGSGGFIMTGTNVVDGSHYDNGSGVLQLLTSGHYAKHTLYIVGDGFNEKYFLVYSQEQFSALALAEQGDIPVPPPYFDDGVVLIASIIVKRGDSAIVEIQDLRPVIGFKAPNVSATTFHGNLLGLGNDDHTQYLLANGARAMSGDLNVGSNNISNVNLVDGVDVSAHASRHLPNGADSLATGVPSSVGTTNSEGTANALSRQDHVHALGSNVVADANISAHTSIKITITNKSQLNSAIAYNDQANTFGDFDQVFRSSRLIVTNPANTFNYTFVGAAIGAARSITLPLLLASDTMVTEAFIQTLTNKTISASSNTISNIADANISAHTSTKITITNKLQLNGAIVYNDQANTYGDFNQIFRSSRLIVTNPANTFNYTFVGSAIGAARNVTLPLLTGDDTLVTEAFIQTLTNKTISASSNTISNIADANISAHTSTKITITNKAQLNSAIVYNDQANTYGDFNQIFRSSRLIVTNPANTFNYTFVGSAIAAARNLTIPLLTGDDTLVTEAFIQTLTNKTVYIPASTTAGANLRVISGAAPTSPTDGDIWNDSTNKILTSFTAGITQYLVGNVFEQTADQTFSATTTETTLLGTGNGTKTLPANFFTVGKTVEITINGIYSRAAGNFTFRIKLGATTIITSATQNPTTNTNESFSLTVRITCRTTGVTGTVISGGVVTIPAGTSFSLATTGTSTINTTASQAIDVTCQFSSNNAGNSITSQISLIKVS